MNKKVLIMSAGTGGHIFPALAVAKSLQQHNVNIEFLGTQQFSENNIFENWQTHSIDMHGVRGKGFFKLITAPFMLLKSLYQAMRLIKNIKPDLVIGFGGYVTVPGGIAAKIYGIPLVIHEQNSIAGSANKLLARFADAICTGFEDVLVKFKPIFTGNPLRQDFIKQHVRTQKSEENNIFNILILGGSLGAKPLNDALPNVFAKTNKNIHIVHQTGAKHVEATRQLYNSLGINAHVVAFIQDMHIAYKDADLVICRAGALTVAEIAAMACVSIIIPLPHAIDNHQFFNANYLLKNEACILIQQEMLENTQHMAHEIDKVLSASNTRDLISRNIRQLAKLDATSHISSLILNMLKL